MNNHFQMPDLSPEPLERSQALRSLFSYIFSYQSPSQIGVCGFTADGRLPAYLRAEMQK